MCIGSSEECNPSEPRVGITPRRPRKPRTTNRKTYNCANMAAMYTKTCGDRGAHWYSEGSVCACGQVPVRLLSTSSCNCVGSRLDPPEHDPKCRSVVWARDRNQWIEADPDVEPRLTPVPERRVSHDENRRIVVPFDLQSAPC